MSAGDLYRRLQGGASPSVAKASILLGVIGVLTALLGVLALAYGFVGGGLFALVVGAVNLFLSVRIRRLERWARLVALVLSGYGAFTSVVTLRAQPVTAVLFLALYGGVIYMLMRPDVVAEFSGRA